MARIPCAKVRVVANAKRFCRVLLDALFPRACAICQEPLATDSAHDHICDACSGSIHWIDSQGADNLFERYRREAAERGQRAFFNRGLTCWEHSGVARKLLLTMKYRGADFLVGDIVSMMERNNRRALEFVENSVLVPVPMHYFKRVGRDYSQTELIADALSKRTNSRVARNLLTCKNHAAQANLTTDERLRNVRNTFRCRESGIDKSTRIVIVDDVITTGATLLACCAAMHRRGFRDVNILTLSHG